MSYQNCVDGADTAGAQRLSHTVPTWSLTLFALALITGCSGGSAVVLSSPPTPGTTPSVPQVTTFAGSGTAASSDGSGRQASLDAPSDITIDPISENLYVLQPSTGSIRTIDTRANVTTLTRALVSPGGLAYNPADGALYATAPDTSFVERIATDGILTNFTQISTGSALPPKIIGRLSADASGDLSITENRAGNVVVVTPSAAVSTTALAPGVSGICFNSTDGKMYSLNTAFGEIDAVSGGASVPVIASSTLQGATGIAYDASNGAYYVASPAKNQILEIVNGSVTVFAGSGTATEADGLLLSAQFNAPTAIVYSSSLHALFVVDAGGNTVREISSFE